MCRTLTHLKMVCFQGNALTGGTAFKRIMDDQNPTCVVKLPEAPA
jgi:hypothetical protein